ncbi:hypothetical protein DPMN_019961 [Dreissena polymorpha]|uniref:Uncharacterized protein n=2 Tax=Dreissena polymorpha TaxID=45954 RepID=A0A9D4NK67_DREPO|nr:hypothetical protein DPMN_019961 [Dreissena polymorpha]
MGGSWLMMLVTDAVTPLYYTHFYVRKDLMASRKDWMATENRTVTLERQMTTRNRLGRDIMGWHPRMSPS